MYTPKAATARTFYYTAIYTGCKRSLDEPAQLQTCLDFAAQRPGLPPAAPVPWFTDLVRRLPSAGKHGGGHQVFMERSGAARMMAVMIRGSHLVVQAIPVLGVGRAALRRVGTMLQRRGIVLHVVDDPTLTSAGLVAKCDDPEFRPLILANQWKKSQPKPTVDDNHPLLQLCLKYWLLGCSAHGLERRLKAAGVYRIDGLIMPQRLLEWLKKNGTRPPCTLPWSEFNDELRKMVGDNPFVREAKIRELEKGLRKKPQPPALNDGLPAASTALPPSLPTGDSHPGEPGPPSRG